MNHRARLATFASIRIFPARRQRVEERRSEHVSKMAAKQEGRRAKRQFTDEFKAGAVRLVLEEGKRVAEVARDLGLTPSTLRVWVERARADRTGGKTGLTTDERAELAALRKEMRVVRMERDILKKAVAFFAKENA